MSALPQFLKDAKILALDSIIAAAELNQPPLLVESDLANSYAYNLVLADIRELLSKV